MGVIVMSGVTETHSMYNIVGHCKEYSTCFMSLFTNSEFVRLGMLTLSVALYIYLYIYIYIHRVTYIQCSRYYLHASEN